MDISTAYKDNNYKIHVARNILENRLNTYTEQYESVYYIIDENVYDIYKDTKLSFIKSPLVVTEGESFKYVSPLMHTMEELLAAGIKRNSLLVVIGGGATGDAGGFIASIVLRGVDYIHVPTTLLAHDSAIGGKTAINSEHGKNLIGAFYRPKAVIYDLEFLDSLPRAEVLSGFGEVYKHAMLNSPELSEELVNITADSIDVDELPAFIIKGIETKMKIVIEDEHESGSRKFLNLGHTLAHAVEYKYKIPHGQAVMLGIIAALYISNELNGTDFNIGNHIDYMRRHGYPVNLLKEMDIDEMMQLMMKDKKNHRNDYISYIVFKDQNTPEVMDIKIENLKKILAALKERI
ncbi:3-dehydroquinate synthase [Jeotgalicoccus coquinae]|uniref:3-dehydroquinate synthase n=1 Tax=Jeotgalicoccus coquinae TaxID=709509 RepID=A0A6V7R7X9_9STAP|nr:3-dehydroquinate synthase [Jeotgalicoccus coquinae]MBB6422946.1 3-dehydroquinate synthase [Jeotgalicoccus coquinae]GGE11923.1 3-dehydroquinate synthase [Jeotgalicoccus coquinae]CAD2073597.1 3-dehydroquinate synthase [Jeotgalicoccus coquinae]